MLPLVMPLLPLALLPPPRCAKDSCTRGGGAPWRMERGLLRPQELRRRLQLLLQIRQVGRQQVARCFDKASVREAVVAKCRQLRETGSPKGRLWWPK